MKTIANFILLLSLFLFILSLGMGSYKLSPENIAISNTYHKNELIEQAKKIGMLDQIFSSKKDFLGSIQSALKETQSSLANGTIPEGVAEWDYKLGDWKIQEYVFSTVKSSTHFPQKKLMSWAILLTLLLGSILFIAPIFFTPAGIKNDGIYLSSLSSGLKLNGRTLFIIATTVGVLIYGISVMDGKNSWSIITTIIFGLIVYLVFFHEKQKDNNPPKSASPNKTAWLGVMAGILLIVFYIFLYWFPEYITEWILMVDPISRALSGNPASQWFLYGFLYTIAVLVMGVRMIAKYRHNRYQMIRTGSVMFFQTAFAFLIPEILVRLNQPWYDFKNIWPLNYSFFFDYNLNNLINSGGMGIFMLVWGIILVIIGVPLFTYLFGKRWYCSWVCGCGGLAETLGDPFRQLSDKSLRAWKFERYIIHGVLVFAVAMTILVLYSYFSGQSNFLFMDSNQVRKWYGFLIGSAFAGVVGTGFYPLMGNRVWCRFGCPLAAYLGLVQRFKSRFRITTNGNQCISCGNCSTYCEMGIDVRWYAQRGQDIVRSSCVGCGVCSAVCPRGVLRLENSHLDVSTRASELRNIQISENEITLLV